MVMATAVDVEASGSIPAGNLQTFLDSVVGTLEYAANAAGAADGKAQYAADAAGTIDYHVRIMAALIGYTGYPAALSSAVEEVQEARAAAEEAAAAEA